MYFFKKAVLVSMILSLFFSTNSFANKLAKEAEIIKDGYPTERRVGGWVSTILGVAAIARGSDIIADKKPLEDDIAAAGLIAVGGIRLVDGVVQLLGRTQVEREVGGHGLNDSEELRRFARSGFWKRMARGTLMLANAALYLHFADKGDEDYDILVWPGAILTVMAGVRFFKRTPEEKAHDYYEEHKNKSKTSFNFMPTVGGGLVMLSHTF